MFFIYTNTFPYIRWPNFFDFSVPSGAPSNVVALTIAPTSVNVSWDQLPTTARNGIVITYEVKYSWPLGSGQLGTMYVNTSGTPNQLVLNNLQECVQYTISVRAYTSQGPGPFSGDILDSSLNSESIVKNTKMIDCNSLKIMGTQNMLRSHNYQMFYQMLSLQPLPILPGAVLWKRTIQSSHILLMSLQIIPALLMQTVCMDYI